MANEKNLIPQAHTLTVDEAKKGGQNSVKSRREKKTVQAILREYLDSDVESNDILTKLANEMKIGTDKSIKEVILFKYLLNSIKKGGLDNMAMLGELLGEEKPQQDTADTENILAIIKECAYEDRNK